MKKKFLRKGFTTGACAAAATGAAIKALLQNSELIDDISIPFPDKKLRTIKVEYVKIIKETKEAEAAVIKDAGDDPDITDGALIISRVKIEKDLGGNFNIKLMAGKGVGIVTKPGLSVPIGEPAINPVPRKMIYEVVRYILNSKNITGGNIEVTISVPKGKELCKKTLNPRLGIKGGISILGTTGIVHPISAEAWMATISLCMDVCIATHCSDKVILVTGRTSERAAQKYFDIPKECIVSMGDYLHFSLKEASNRVFKYVIVCAQWSKMLKGAMGWSQTHVRHGVLTPKDAIKFLSPFSKQLGIELPKEANSAREIFFYIAEQKNAQKLFKIVCDICTEKLSSLLRKDQKLSCYLVSYDGEIID